MAQVRFYQVRRKVGQHPIAKRLIEVLHGPLVALMRPCTTHWRFGIVLQKPLRPLPEGRVFTLPHDIQDMFVSGLEPFTQPLLCLLPIGRLGGFFVTSA
jgi:hypothetical protein